MADPTRYRSKGKLKRAKQADALYRRAKTATAKRVDELGEEAVKEKLLEEFGAKALSRRYDPVVQWSLGSHKAGSPGVPVLFLSDIHAGEVVNPAEVFQSNHYNMDQMRRRMRHTVETAAALLKVHMARPDYPGIVLALGGDMISGALHEDLLATDEGSPIAQALAVSEALADAVAFLAAEFPRVTAYCVAGNHGRTTRKPRTKFYAETNLDWLCYKMLERHVASLENVEIHAPNARDLTFTVASRRYRLTHGDQFKGGDGIIGALGPIIRGDVRKRVVASLMPGQPEGYDTMLCGHFHQLTMLPRVIVNGSMKGYDEYALSINVPWEPPQQALWTVHPKHGHTWYLPIICDPAYSAHGRVQTRRKK